MLVLLDLNTDVAPNSRSGHTMARLSTKLHSASLSHVPENGIHAGRIRILRTFSIRD